MDDFKFWSIDNDTSYDFLKFRTHRNPERNERRDKIIDEVGFNTIADFINSCNRRDRVSDFYNVYKRFKIVVFAYPTIGKTTTCDVVNKVNSVISKPSNPHILDIDSGFLSKIRNNGNPFIMDIDSGAFYKMCNNGVYVPHEKVTEEMRIRYLVTLRHFLISGATILLVNDFHKDVIEYVRHFKNFLNHKCLYFSVLPNYGVNECVKRVKNRGPYSGGFLKWIENYFEEEIPKLEKDLRNYMPVVKTEYLLNFLVNFFNHHRNDDLDVINDLLNFIY